METNREIRFLVPPVVAFASVFWSVVIDPAFNIAGYLGVVRSQVGGDPGWSLLLGGGAAVIAAGYLISALPVFVLSQIDWLRSRPHEADLSERALDHLAAQYPVDAPQTKEQRVYLVNYYVHGVLSKDFPSLFDWCLRRWNHFMVSVHVICALTLSLFGGLLLQYLLHHRFLSWRLFVWWVLPSIVLMVILGFNARRAFKQNWGMVEFIAGQNRAMKEDKHDKQ